MRAFKVAVIASVVALQIAIASADMVHTGTYTYSQAPQGSTSWMAGDYQNAGPIDYTTSSLLGDSNTSVVALWANGSNQIGSNGVIITFDLGSDYEIGTVTTSHHCPGYFGVGAVDFYYSTDGQSFTLAGIDNRVNTPTSGDNYYSRTFDFGGTEAQYVKLHVHSAPWFHLTLGEVQIDGTPVPEPTTAAMILLGGVGALIRRKR